MIGDFSAEHRHAGTDIFHKAIAGALNALFAIRRLGRSAHPPFNADLKSFHMAFDEEKHAACGNDGQRLVKGKPSRMGAAGMRR